MADTSNQALCCSVRTAPGARATELHQFGYGRSRFFYSFVVALVLFTLGAVFRSVRGATTRSATWNAEVATVAIVIPMLQIGLEGWKPAPPWWSPGRLAGSGLVAVHPPVPQPGCPSCCSRTRCLLGLAFALLGVG